MINNDVRKILNNATLLANRDKYIELLTSIYSGNTPSKQFYLCGITGQATADILIDPEKWVEEALISLSNNAQKSLNENVFVPLCVECSIYGVHFIDSLFGARVWHDKEAGQWYSDYLKTEIGELKKPDISKHKTWDIAKRVVKAFNDSKVSLPFFGLPTIASALNIAINLYGENILVTLMEEPEKAVRDLKIINELLIELHTWYIKNLQRKQLQPVVAAFRTQPPGYGQICGCSTHLVSPGIYKDMIMPLDEALLSVYPNGGMIHLCGSHKQHIPAWKNSRALRVFQLNDAAADDLEAYLSGLRDDQVIFLNPTNKTTAKKALSITKGKHMVVVADDPA